MQRQRLQEPGSLPRPASAFCLSLTLLASTTSSMRNQSERMDLATFAKQDTADVDVTPTTLPPKGPSLVDEEHVSWQSSQCREVLSRLMVSTKKRFQRDSSPAESQGWPLGPLSADSSPQSDSGNFAAFSRRPLSRTRTSEENIGPPLGLAKSTTSSASIPFFDKENPARFFALLKGVSARVDENAGVRNHDIPGPCGPTDGTTKLKRKRPQFTTAGRSLAAKRIKPSTFRGEENGRISNDFEFSNSQNLRGSQSLPDIAAADRFSQGLQNRPVLFHESPRVPKDALPPPCPAATQKLDFNDTGSGHPKLHPHLQNAVSKPSSMTPPRGSCSRIELIRGFSNSNPATGVVHSGKMLSPGSATSSRTSTPEAGRISLRPPVLGMRRTHTMPSQPYNLQILPTKQKGFKPPLLPNRLQQLDLTLKAKPPS